MHPKTPADLDIPDALWSDLHDDVIWLLEQLLNFVGSEQKSMRSNITQLLTGAGNRPFIVKNLKTANFNDRFGKHNATLSRTTSS